MNIELFPETTFSEFEIATAKQISISNGRDEPVKSDFELAFKKVAEWKEKRRLMGLPEWK